MKKIMKSVNYSSIIGAVLLFVFLFFLYIWFVFNNNFEFIRKTPNIFISAFNKDIFTMTAKLYLLVSGWVVVLLPFELLYAFLRLKNYNKSRKKD